MTLEQAEQNFSQAVSEWAKADQECSRLYLLWEAACTRRKRLAAEKSDAWGEREMARAESNVQQTPGA